MKRLLLVFLFIFTGIVQAKTIEIERPDGSKLLAYFEEPANPSYPIVFLIHGSTCTSAFPMFKMTAPALTNNGIGVIALEKYGMSNAVKDCPAEYLKNNFIQSRIQDHLLAASFVRKNMSRWNGKFGWAGASEGGQIAALTAPLVPETAMIAMLASGGGLTMAEELPIAFQRLLRRQGATEEQILQKKAELESQYALIKADPTPWKEWLSDGNFARNTYRYWDSILWVKAMPLLEKMDIPMLLVHGTEDTSCPIESSEALVARFNSLGKTNLTFLKYPGLEHNWTDLEGKSNTQKVLGDTFGWIFQHLGN